MTGNSLHAPRLHELTETIFDPHAVVEDLEAAIRETSSLYATIGEQGGASPPAEDTTEARLPCGLAISPRDAATCLLDAHRTTRFLHGVDAAIREARRRFSGERIDLLYAGCGPYAALVMPLCTRFSPEEVRLSLLDLHPQSLDHVQGLIEGFGFAAFFGDIRRQDAGTYEHPDGAPLHVVVTEAMQQALSKEPQLAITANLAPQLRPGGIFVPERVTVDLDVIDPEREFRHRSPGDAEDGPAPRGEQLTPVRVLDVTRESASELVRSAAGRDSLPERIIEVPRLPDGVNWLAVLRTGITTFAPVVVEEYASGLTRPAIVEGIGALRGGERIALRYELGEIPGFTARVLDPGR